MKTLRSSALIALLWSAPASACAGVIHGTLRMPQVAPSVATGRGAHGNAGGRADARAPGPLSDAVVYVDHVPAATESVLAAAGDRPARLVQQGQRFVPRVLTIVASTSVEFDNRDRVDHSVFSLSPTRPFDLGLCPRGSARLVDFPRPGIVDVYCDLHPSMEAFIVVLAHHGFARPDTAGEFRLPDLPAGTYVLHAWHPDLGEQTVSVTVPEVGLVAADPSYAP
jgi:plastocyanin